LATDIFNILPEDFPRLQNGDTFRFACTRCGECCFDQLVLLEPQDMLGLVRHTGLSTAGVFAAGIVALTNVDGQTRVVLRQVPFFRGTHRIAAQTRCEFVAPEIENDRAVRFGCQLHAAGNKPLVCRLSPIAVSDDGYRLVPPIADCPGMNQGLPLTLNLAAESEALALSRFYHQEVEPRLGQDLQRAFIFEATDLAGLSEHLRSLL
jgi:Fe-S-cluster containining protein